MFMAMMNPVAMISKHNTSYKVISPPPLPFRIEGEEVAAIVFDDFLVDSIAIFACDDKRDKHSLRRSGNSFPAFPGRRRRHRAPLQSRRVSAMIKKKRKPPKSGYLFTELWLRTKPPSLWEGRLVLVYGYDKPGRDDE